MENVGTNYDRTAMRDSHFLQMCKEEIIMGRIWPVLSVALPVTYTMADAIVKTAFDMNPSASRKKVINRLTPLCYQRKIFNDRENYMILPFGKSNPGVKQGSDHKGAVLALWVYLVRYAQADHLRTFVFNANYPPSVCSFSIEIYDEETDSIDVRSYEIGYASSGTEALVIDYAKALSPLVKFIAVVDDAAQIDLYKRKLQDGNYIAQVIPAENALHMPEIGWQKVKRG